MFQTNDPTGHAEILARRDDCEPHYVDDRKYFELGTFYAEFAKDYTERRLPMEYQPEDAAIDVYREWQQCNSGNHHVPTQLPPSS